MKNSKPLKNSNTTFERLKTFSFRHITVLLLFEVIGIGLMYTSKYINQPDFSGFVHEVGILFTTIIPVLFVYEFILRGTFIREMKNNVYEVFENATKQIVPHRYSNIRQMGIVDTFYQLNLDKINEEIKEAYETEIKFLKIWIPLMERFEDSIIEAINEKKCKVRIILLDPELGIDAINKRSACLKYYDVKSTQDEIKKNKDVLQSIYNCLDEDKKDNLQLRFHNNFISVSLFGVDAKLIQGFYLHDKIATEGTHLVIRDKNSKFHQDLSYHFEKQWSMSSEYKFVSQ